MKDILIIKTEALIPKEKMKELHTDFVEQLKTGVVIIPAYFEAKLIHTPDDIEVIVKCEEKRDFIYQPIEIEPKIKSLNDDDTLPFNILNPRYQAILEVDRLLTEENIPHELLRLMDGWKIAYPKQDGCQFDVIEHRGSYGHESDLMEAYGYSIDDVEGHLSVDDAMKLFRKVHEELKKENNNEY